MQTNIIYNADCLGLRGLRDLPDKSIDLVVTDPPYLIETSGGGLCDDKEGIVKQFREHDLDFMKDGFSDEVLDELCRVMKKINIYLFCSQKQIIFLIDYFVKKKKCNWNL